MTTSRYDEELCSSIASLSPPVSPKSETLKRPKVSDQLTLEVFPTPEPTIFEIQSSSTQTSTVNTQPLSSALKTRHSNLLIPVTIISK